MNVWKRKEGRARDKVSEITGSIVIANNKHYCNKNNPNNSDNYPHNNRTKPAAQPKQPTQLA
jgi:hypothetical protein